MEAPLKLAVFQHAQRQHFTTSGNEVLPLVVTRNRQMLLGEVADAIGVATHGDQR